MLFPPARRGLRGRDARAKSESEPENRAEERGAEGKQPEDGADFGSGTARDDRIVRCIAMSRLGMRMVVSMAVRGIMRVVGAGMIVRMHDSLDQLMHVLREPTIRFQADMEHRSEPGQGQEESEDGLPIAHILRSP
jgi:hypothetical protein